MPSNCLKDRVDRLNNGGPQFHTQDKKRKNYDYLKKDLPLGKIIVVATVVSNKINVSETQQTKYGGWKISQ